MGGLCLKMGVADAHPVSADPVAHLDAKQTCKHWPAAATDVHSILLHEGAASRTKKSAPWAWHRCRRLACGPQDWPMPKNKAMLACLGGTSALAPPCCKKQEKHRGALMYTQGVMGYQPRKGYKGMAGQ